MKKINLRIIIISCGLGLIVYSWYAYIIDAFSKFNFFTIYLPLLAFDLFNFIYFYKTDETFKAKFSKETLSRIFQKIKKNNSYILVLLVIIILQIIVFISFISAKYELYSVDTYDWFSHSMHLKKYGNIDYVDIRGYPAGIIFFITGSSFFINTYAAHFFYFKYVMIYFFIINIMSLFYVSKRIFDREIYVFLTLIIMLSFTTYISRSLVTLPSVIATTLGYVFLLTFEWEDKLKYIFLRGIILGGIFLFHPLMCFFILIVYFSSEIILFLIMLRSSKESREISSLKSLKMFLINTLLLVFFIFLAVVPFMINQTITNPYEQSFIGNYLHFLGTQLHLKGTINYRSNWSIILINIFWDFFVFFVLRGGRQLLEIFYEIPFWNQMYEFYTHVISFGIILIIIGLFYNYKRDEIGENIEKTNFKMIFFIKISFIASLIYFLIIGMMEIIQLKRFSILGLYNFKPDVLYIFLNRYKFRILELFEGFWAILFTIAIIKLKKPLKKLYISVVTRKKDIKDFQFGKREKVIFLIGIIACGSYFYTTNFWRISYTQKYTNEEMEVFLYMGDYFDTKSDTDYYNLLAEESSHTAIFQLISYHDNLDIEEFEFNDTMVYSDLKISEDEIDYIMVKKSSVSGELMDDIEDEFEELFQNVDYYFGEKK